MPSVMTRSQFQRQMFPGVRENIFRGYKEFPAEWSQIFTDLSTSKAFEEDHTMAGVGLPVRTPENMEYPEDQFTDGYAKRYDVVDYTLKIGASLQVRRDAVTSFWKERAPDMGFSFRQAKEIMHADLFNSGFTAATGPDGVPLFSANHKNPRQGTQSNILNPVSTVNVLGVRLALSTFRRFFDDTGIRRRMLMAEKMVVPPEEEYNALEILKSAGRPDTANRADNVVRNALTPFVWDYLTDPNNWFVLAGKGQLKLKSFTRTPFAVSEYLDENTDIQWVKGREAYSFGHSHWIGTLGSNPV